MVWVIVGIAAALVVFISWFAVTLVNTRLGATPTLAVFDIEEATDYIAENLPDQVVAKLSHDDVRVLLRYEVTYFRERGVASFGGVDHAAELAIRSPQPAVAAEDDLVDELLARARSEGMDCDEVDIVCVTDLTTDYLVAIGAIGEPVDMQALAPPTPLGELEADSWRPPNPNCED